MRKNKERTFYASSKKSNRHYNGSFYGASCFIAGAFCAVVLTTSHDSAQVATRLMSVDCNVDASVWNASKAETSSNSDNNSQESTTKVVRQIVRLSQGDMKRSDNAAKHPLERLGLHPSFCRTSSTGYEILLESFLGMIFSEDGFLHEGSVLDVGAQFGEQACHFASLHPDRKVYALDPSPNQCNKISKFAEQLPNLQVINAGIGRAVGKGVAGPAFTGMKPGDEFRVETIDNLFFNKGERLAFAHIDVEGKELDVLHGGNQTILAYKPVFTAELRVHQNPDYSRQLLDYINQLGYDAYVIDEPVGWPHMDYRNLINFPRSMMDMLEYSDAFNFAVATEAIIPVNSKTIFDNVYPCCALGGECCAFNSTNDKQCCNERFMRKWHRKRHIRKPIAMQGFRYSRSHIYEVWGRWRQRPGMTPEEALL